MRFVMIMLCMFPVAVMAAEGKQYSKENLRTYCSHGMNANGASGYDGCCESAVNNVINKPGAFPIKEKGAGACPEGFMKNMNKCPGGFAWCEPVEEKK